MKSLKFLLIIFTLIGLTGFISCIQEEAANSEADITKAYVENIALKDNPIIENRNVIFYVGKDADCSTLAPDRKSVVEGKS